MKDSLYFDSNYYGREEYFSVLVDQLSYIDIEANFPSGNIAPNEREKLEASEELIDIAYRSSKGMWLYEKHTEQIITYTFKDIGYYRIKENQKPKIRKG